MIYTIEQLKRIAGDGGGLILDASAFTLSQITQISAAAAGGQASITLRNVSGLTVQQLRELSVVAPGLIVFDMTH